ncbi:MAG: S28 family serine protease [Bacteroidales bacterium]|jgi:hypothetical protein|nr:S28 family serine protease [Bacteroidales bacterium]
MNRKYFSYLTFVIALSVWFTSCDYAQDLKTKLSRIDGTEISAIDADSIYSESYDIRYTQPLDHNNPDKGNFKQRVIVNHVGYDRPTVVVLEGYELFSTKAGELSKLLNANQITIEHRFYGESQPDSVPWDLLNVRQAAADQHKIIQSLKKIYPGKWISTGISKGGQTTIFHRRYYPDDVDVSVPYVAPLNLAREDPRISKHLATVGTRECREKIQDFQTALFEKKDKILPLVKKHAKDKDYQFKNLGIERAYDLNVLEYSFAFWQWNGDCKTIPPANADHEELFRHWISTASFSFFDVIPLSSDQLFSYQALTEMGFYDYDITPFQQYLDDTVNITFDFKIPSGVEYSYNPLPMDDINDWIQQKGNFMLYIYGEYDPWGATGVDPSENTIAVKMVNPKGNHSTRISSFPKDMQQNIYTLLESWLDIELEINNKKGLMPREVLEIL